MNVRRVATVVAIVAAAWVVAVTVTLVRADRAARAGLRATRSARAHLAPDDLARGRPVPYLATAGRRFRAADRGLRAPLLGPVHLMPVVGRQLRSAERLARAAGTTTAISRRGVAAGRAVLAERPTAPGERVALLDRLAGIARGAEHDLAAIRLGPRVGLLPPLARARNALADDLVRLRSTVASARAVTATGADLLRGPTRYLVVGANNAEMRAGSGMWLSAGELTIDQGRLTLAEMRSLPDVPVPPGVPIDDADLAARWGWLVPNQEWRNLMPSPRVAASARLAARMWTAAGHAPPQGVLVIDPVALRGILRATGPVTVANRRVEANDVVGLLEHGQYQQFGTATIARRDALADFARAAFGLLDGSTWDPAVLAGELGRAARGRHVLLWSADPAAQATWEAARIAGGLQPDSVFVSVLNRGGNKLDRFLRATGQMTFRRPRAGPVHGTITLQLTNTTPAGESPYVAGPHPGSGVTEGEYLGIAAVSLPGDARNVAIAGRHDYAVYGPDGPSLVAGYQLQVKRGETVRVVVTFELPRRMTSVLVQPSARVPAIRWRSGPPAGRGAGAGPRAGRRKWSDRAPFKVPLP